MIALAFHCCRTPAKASSSSARAVLGLSTHMRDLLSQLFPWLACRSEHGRRVQHSGPQSCDGHVNGLYDSIHSN